MVTVVRRRRSAPVAAPAVCASPARSSPSRPALCPGRRDRVTARIYPAHSPRLSRRCREEVELGERSVRLTNSAGSTTSSASAPPASWNDLRRHEHGAQRADRRRTFRSGSGHTRERVVGGGEAQGAGGSGSARAQLPRPVEVGGRHIVALARSSRGALPLPLLRPPLPLRLLRGARAGR